MRPYSILELIRMVEALVGKQAMINHVPAHVTEMPATWAKTDKVRRLLDGQSEVPLDEGLPHLGRVPEVLRKQRSEISKDDPADGWSSTAAIHALLLTDSSVPG